MAVCNPTATPTPGAASDVERVALVALRGASADSLSDTMAEAWLAFYPAALSGCTAREAKLLELADCAVEFWHREQSERAH